MKNDKITSRETDFAAWYTDVVKAAHLADYTAVKGCIAIEPRVRSGASDIITLDDSWGVVSKDGKLTCHYENDVIITENGPIITSVDENVRQHLKELGTIA